MNIIIDKLIICILCLFTMLNFYPSISYICVLGFLIAIGTTFLCTYINPDLKVYTQLKEKWILYIIFSVYILLCIIQPVFCFFLPLLMYDTFTLRNPVFIGISFLILMVSHSELSMQYLLFLIFLCCISALLQNYNVQSMILTEKLKLLRDTTTEYNLMLKQKNADLLQRQDYDIHLATLKERNRIAREIHDNVGHMLSRSILQVGAVIAINKESSLSGHLNSLKDTLSGAMDSIRNSVHDLHDESIDLKSAVEGMLGDLKSYQITFDYDMGTDIPRNVKYCFISIVKEAVSNIVKHSNGEKIFITLREHPSLFQLVIKDNGTGATSSQSGGIGLENMRERAVSLNGNFTVNSKHGFQIFITIPKQQEEV